MIDLPDPMAFYKIVWEIVRQIPEGTAATYGQIASMIPAPEGIDPVDYDKLGPRWVGDAMNAVSRVDEPTIPWHRVINAKGGISLPDDSKSAALQRARLRAEHILPDDQERVDLGQFGWEGPSQAWLDAHGLYAPRPLKKARQANSKQSNAAQPNSTLPNDQPGNDKHSDDPPQQMRLF